MRLIRPKILKLKPKKKPSPIDYYGMAYLCRMVSHSMHVYLVTFFYECVVDESVQRAETQLAEAFNKKKSLPPAVDALLPKWLLVSCDMLWPRTRTYITSEVWSCYQGA